MQDSFLPRGFDVGPFRFVSGINVIQRGCIVVRSYDLALHGYAIHRSVGATNPCPSQSNTQLPQWNTAHIQKPNLAWNQALRSISVRKTGLAEMEEARPGWF